jgi:DNA-binding transcriptional regulator YdaS (Cro superfamily)
MQNVNVNEVIDLLGGTNKVAQLLGVTAPSISQWRSRHHIPEGQLVRMAARVERVSEGRITRRALFPDEWERIWPELALLPVAVHLPARQQPSAIVVH